MARVAELVISLDDLSDPQVVALLEGHLEQMREVSPPESVHALDVEALRAPEITFWAARDGDEVVGVVELPTDEADLVFVSSEAQLLRFAAKLVRPQGRAAGGMAGINLAAGAKVVWFGAVDLNVKDGEWGNVVVTVSGSSSALPGTQTGSAKVTPFAEYPAKGRATGGVRCHRFTRGEDTLLLAWAGPSPAHAATSTGAAVDLPPSDSRRDGSGLPLKKAVAAISGPRPVFGASEPEEGAETSGDTETPPEA